MSFAEKEACSFSVQLLPLRACEDGQPHVETLCCPILVVIGNDSYLHELQGEARTLGTFKDPVEAPKCYDRAAIEAHGANAVLNFPPVPINRPTLPGARQHPLGPDDEGQCKEGPPIG
jgi:hypothetical protein